MSSFNMSPSFWVTLLVFLLFTTSSSSSMDGFVVNGLGRRGTRVGGRMEIKDVKTNKEVQELGKFSVEEFNKNLMQNSNDEDGGGFDRRDVNEYLTFYEVVEAQRQVVSGIKYYLKISAGKSNGVEKKFDAIVVVKAWLQHKELVNFTPSIN